MFHIPMKLKSELARASMATLPNYTTSYDVSAPNKLNRSDVAQFILFDFRFSSSACTHLNNICVILKRSTITIECRGNIRVSTVHGHKYSSPSIFYYIFHTKPHLKKKYFKAISGQIFMKFISRHT